MRASGGEDEELDFRLIFGEEFEKPQSGPGCSDLEADDSPAYVDAPSFTVNQPIGIPRHGAPSRAGMHSPPPRPAADADYGDTYESQPARLIHLGGCTVLACPSIQITSISPGAGGQEMEPADEEAGPDFWGGRDHLYLPLDPFGYRDCSLSPSPASSYSSPWGWLSDASSCGSGSHLSDDVEPELSEAALRCALGCPADEAWPSPGSPSPGSPGDECRLSPRQPASGPPSRPCSPCGKRRHSGCEAYYYYHHHRHRRSPSPSPGPSRRGSVTDEPPHSSSSSSSSPLLPPSTAVVEDVPLKARRTSQEQSVALYRQAQEGEGEAASPYLGQEAEEGPAAHQLAKKDATPMEYLTVPSPFVWTKARIGGHSPVFRASALPPLDWPLPSHYEHLDLKIEVQPKTHHRAHYETEGSRGAVKATLGGHPVVKLQGYLEKPLTLQMFIGTADDRNLRPHAFYQVHRITGKMVATSSQEAVVSTTKVLEVSLLPENNMTASIDCAGILKLRNSDIELRKGETDIGRKNTRVKLVFRVHVPQPNGKVVSLQVASVPIECSQRSAHELPQVESYNVNSSPVTGGDELLLTGCNFLPESKVVFIEKGPDGRPQWEVDAKINSVRSTETLIVAEVPPYRNQSLTRAAQVCFLVCNGKRKRSPCQCFQYLPVLIKEEPYEGFEVEPDSPLHSPLEYPPSVPTAGLCQPPSTLSDPGVFAPASPAVPLPPNPGCPAPKAFGDACPHPSPVPGLPAFLLDAEWNEACKQVPPGFGCCLTPPNHGHPLTPPKHGHPLTPPNHGHPLTPPNHGHPLTPPNHGHPLTPPKHGHPLTPPNHGHPMTPPNQGDPLTPPSHGHPLTPPNHGHPLTPPNHGHPLTPPNQGHHLTPTNQGHPLTPPKQGHPLTSLNQGHHLTPTNQGHPLTPLNEGQPLTPLNQGQPLTPTNQGHPLTPTNHGHPLNPTNHGHPLAPPNQGHPLTPLNQGHPLTHLPLGPSCSYSPPDWPSGADLHLPVPPAGPFYPTPSQALGHCSPPAQSLGNGLGPPPPLAPPRGRALYPPELPAAHAPSSCRLAPHRPSFPSGSVPTSGVFQDTGQAEADTAAAPPESSPSRQHRPFLEQPPPPPARGQDQGGGEATAPPETPAVDAKGETMECDLTFSTIPIQGITLDDVNEIIGRDLTEVPESLRADGAMDNP